MKEVYVLRHSNWDGVTDALTDPAKRAAQSRAAKLPNFALVYASPFVRTAQTAQLLTGKQPQLDERAAIPRVPEELRQQVATLKATHPLRVAGALFSLKAVYPALETAGAALVELINELLACLPDGARALVVTHDGTMLAAQRVLGQVPMNSPLTANYAELDGYVVRELSNHALQVVDLQTVNKT
ncbi:MAG TPA: histidine phosphatase family protein [Candidatus Saccharimonadales bacterium]|nr:histidine phosphatase family protein [Candidatus Saccharimonadales bacterium]